MFIFLKTLGNFVGIGDLLEIMVAVNAQFYLVLIIKRSLINQNQFVNILTYTQLGI